MVAYTEINPDFMLTEIDFLNGAINISQLKDNKIRLIQIIKFVEMFHILARYKSRNKVLFGPNKKLIR